MGPGVAALEGKIIRVRHDAPFRRHVFGHLIGDAPAFAISNGLLLTLESQAQCWRMSPDAVQPISGSTCRGGSGSKSSTQSLVLAKPDCIAVLDGL